MSIRAQDEILQLLYWMKGERLGEIVAREQIERFIQLTPEQLNEALDALLRKGLLTRGEADGGTLSWQLTNAGTREGARRFTDELSSILGHESHLECGDPDCDCHGGILEGPCEKRGRADA